MGKNPKSIELIQWLSKFENQQFNNIETVTLICFCDIEENYYRSIIKELAVNWLS